ncbi:MAG: type II toxin-antitoxin system PemK/MazF family toxin [bacterium]|nr:type II toxin-antitoxin system PemK/MazF family toxin [bacterium]
MEIPEKIRIPLCIEQGSVFNFFIDFSDSKRQSKNRYFVVLNRNPKTDVVLIMITPTKQVQKKKDFVRRSGITEKTIVEVKAKEHPIFTTDSAFNCNEIFEVKMDDLIRKIEENGSMNHPKLANNILKRIMTGINESPEISQEIKDLIE